MFSKIKEKYISLSPQMRASIWFLICSVLQKGISVITTPIFTRLLNSAEYGQFNVFYSWLSIVSIIVTLNLCSGVFTMGIVKFREEENIFTSSLQGLTLVLCIAWTCIYLASRSFWNHLLGLTTVQMLAMLTMTWTSAVFSFWMTTQRNQFKYKLLVAVTLVVSVLKPLLGIIFVIKSEDKVTARILAIVLVEILCYTAFFFIQMFRGKVFYSKKYWKYAILFNIPLIPHYLSGTILTSSDRIMISKMVGESEAGIYSLAYSLALLMTMVNEALNKTMSPWLYQRIREKEFTRVQKVVYPSLVIVAVCNLFLIVVAPELVMVFAPPEYSEAIYAIVPVALSGFFSYMYLCFAPFEFYYEKRIWTTIGTLTSAMLNIVLNLICIRMFGYVAAGYTTLFCSIVNATMHYYFMRKVCNTYLEKVKPYSGIRLLFMSGTFVIAGLIFIPTYKIPIIRYTVVVLMTVVVFIKRKEFISLVKGITRN